MIRLTYIMDLYSKWIFALSEAWNFFTTPFSESFKTLDTSVFFDFPIVQTMLFFLKSLNFTPIELMLSGLLVFYIIYQFIIWVLNLIT